MLTARFRSNPLLPPPPPLVIDRAMTIAEIVAATGAPDWFREQGEVRLNGHVILPGLWHVVRVKPEAEGVVELYAVPQGKKTALILGAVALTALTAGIGAGGIAGAFGLGASSTFAAGGLGATLAAAGVGIAGQLALTALAAPPTARDPRKAKELGQAGISGNVVELLEPLPVILGTIDYSPPLIAPAHTYMDGDAIHSVAMVGVQGQAQITNVRVNGVLADNAATVSYETGDGGPASAAPTLITYTYVEQSGFHLSQFDLRLETGYGDWLTDQDTPANSEPSWHTFITDGDADEIWLRFLFPGGILTTSAGNATVPLRIDIREAGTSTWKKLPTFHLRSVNDSGPMRTQIKLKFVGSEPKGRRHNYNLGLPVWLAVWKAAPGASFEYSSETYFGDTAPSDVLPVMTAATTSGVTISASTQQGGSEAWRAADNSPTASCWRPTNNSLPADFIVQLSAAATIKSYLLFFNGDGSSDTSGATVWTVWGSNDGTNYTQISSEDFSDNYLDYNYCQIETPGSYLYYKFTFEANNGAANEALALWDFQLYTTDVNGGSFEDSGAYFDVDNLARHVDLTSDGAEVYLQTATFPRGTYEIRVKRGIALKTGILDPSGYTYSGSVNNSNFFDYYTASGRHKVSIGQTNYNADGNIDRITTVEYAAPVDTDGIAWIVVDMKNAAIESISATFASYARVWDGSVWLDTPQVTANPAALYRSVLLGWANADPVPGEIIDEDALAAWFDRCDTAAHQCNAIASGLTVAQVLQLIASCGYASPRLSNVWSVVEDYDRSADAVTMMITPLNSRDLGTTNPGQRLPHAIQAEYADETDSYAVKHVTVYADGYSAATATLIERVTYTGFTNSAKVTARAEFDLKTARLRTARYVRELGWDGYLLKRGDLVGLADDVLDLNQAYARIASVQTSAGNVVSVTVDAVMPFSTGQGDVVAVSDITSLADILDPDQAMGLAIRLEDGTVLLKQVSEVTDSNVCTFSTPFADTGVVVAGLLVAAGVHGRVVRRCMVLSIEPTGIDSMRVTLADEAPEIFA